MSNNFPSGPLSRIHAYHRLSSHRLDGYAPGPGGLDWATQPNPFRRYAGAPRIELPLAADRLTTPFSALYGHPPPQTLPVSLSTIALILELSLGLSAWKQAGETRWALRCNPSSGNLHPTEGYVITPALEGLGAGVYHYYSLDHALVQRAAVATAPWNEVFGQAGFIVGLTSIHWREAWKYGLRAFRYCQHDVGHALAALRYAAAAVGWQARLLDRWGDDEIATLLGLNRHDDFPIAEERENADLVLWLGTQPRAIDAEPLLAAANRSTWYGCAEPLSSGHRHWPAIDEASAATAKPRTPALPWFEPPPCERSLSVQTDVLAAQLIRQRRSAVAFDGTTAITAARWFSLLDALMPQAGIAPWDALPWRPRLHPLFFVHRVTGIEPGIYLLSRDPQALPALRAGLHADAAWHPCDLRDPPLPLYALALGDCRTLAQDIACHQEIAADSAFAVAMLALFDDALQHGPWGYRYLHWEAGMLGQVLYLEAEAAGMRGTGIGCFFDDELHRLVGIGDTTLRTLYHFTVGGPVEDGRLTTLAGYAHLTGRNALGA